MKKGQLFKAVDKLGREYIYEYLGENREADTTGCAYINLYNLTTQSHTNVEEEWFNQRTITPLEE